MARTTGRRLWWKLIRECSHRSVLLLGLFTMLRIRALTVVFAIGLLTIATANGQSPIGNGLDLTPAPTNLVVEVYYYPNEPPAYMVVAPANSPPGGSWYARFRQLPGRQVPAGALPVTAVDIKTLLTGNDVRVSISVFMGKR